tara:strand:+ start:1896 stop:2375 length:480 start_codon:yes stop_codon:yes gene_type:complete
MAYFSKLDDNNVVIQVVSVNNSVLLDENGVEQESKGIEFLHNLYKDSTAVWKQTSYNTHGGVHSLGGTPFRKNYGALNFIYNEEGDAFHAPVPYDDVNDRILHSWTLNTTTYIWEPPTPCPETYDDGRMGVSENTGEEYPLSDLYEWNEDTLTWDKISS